VALVRGLMSDEEWAFFEPFVVEKGPRRGRRPRDHRRVLDGVFWIARTGTAWRDLHSHFGEWNSVYRQFRRWTLAGTWEVMLEALNEAGAGHGSVQMIDSTIIRAHQHAAGALKAIGSGLGSWPLARWLLDQDPSPLQRSGPPRRGLSERRSGLGCEGLCAGD
jgi:transposase